MNPKNSRKNGKIISFEGITGCGKTTLIERIKTSLKNRGYSVYIKPDIYTYQDDNIGGDIKKILIKDPQFLRIGYPVVEALLIAAKRAYDTERYLKPALSKGKIVLLDRAIDTYFAYHTVSIMERFPNMKIKQIIDWLSSVDKIGGIIPDLTIYLALDIETAIKRSEKHFVYNQEIKKYYESIVNMYEYLAQIYSNRIVRIDAKKSISNVYKETLKIILKYLGDSQ